MSSRIDSSVYFAFHSFELVGWLFVCFSFISWQHLRSNQYGYQLVTLRTHWKDNPQGPGPAIPFSHIILTLKLTSPRPILIMPSAWLAREKCQSLSDWFDYTRLAIQRGFESHDPSVEVVGSSHWLHGPVRQPDVHHVPGTSLRSDTLQNGPQ